MSGKRRLLSIDGFPKSYVLVPEGDSETAITFVHGFAGSPTATWCDFQGLCDEYASEYPWWKTATLFFYSYDSTRRPIHYNAVRLRSFLELTLANAQSAQTNWKYKRLALVGHSEGAVVIRRMILNRIEALQKKGGQQGLDGQDLQKWIDANAAGDLILDSRVQLFAPACAGTNFSGALGFFFGLSTFFAAIASSYLVRNELSQGSPILLGLQAGTESAFREHPKISGLPARILFGSNDQVVFTDKYACDEIVEPYAEGQDHFSVCKPKYIYSRPLEFVRV